jgi:hypothetical protein
MRSVVVESGTDQRETMLLGTPATISDRNSLITKKLGLKPPTSRGTSPLPKYAFGRTKVLKIYLQIDYRFMGNGIV